MHEDVGEMSREQLARELASLRAQLSDRSEPSHRLLDELKLHQAELEAQNVQLRRAQEELEQSRNRYAELYDFAPVGYCTLDAAGVIEEVNLTAAAMLGYDRGPLVGAPLGLMLPAAQRQRFQAFLAQRRAEATEGTLEVTLAGRPGAALAAQLVVTPRRPVAGGPGSGFLVALIDIRPLKQLEARLRFLADVSELVGSGIELEGTLGRVSALAVPFLADLCFVDLLDEAGTISRLEPAFADPSRSAVLGPGLRAAATGEPGTPQTRAITSCVGRLYPALAQLGQELGPGHPLAEVLASAGAHSMMVVPLMTRGRTLGALTFATCDAARRYDLSDLAFAEEIARRAAMSLDNARLLARQQRDTRAREDLLAVVSHDLKTPLSVIAMSIGSAMRGFTEANDRRQSGRRDLSRALRATERMAVLINDLLDAASIDAGQFAVDAGRMPLPALVTDAVELFVPLASAKDVSLSATCGEVAEVLGDPGRVQQVLANLLGNAIKFTPPGGAISVGADPAGDYVRVWVRDSGPGIPAAQAVHVFDRFWKAERSRRGGSGLGLFIARGIVAAHGGRIWVEQAAAGGSCFSFTLARAAATAPPAHVGAAVEALGGSMAKHAYAAGELARPLRAPVRRGPARTWLDLEYLGLASHELREPATAIALQLDRLACGRDGTLSRAQGLTVRRLTGAVGRLNAAIEMVLQQALLDHGLLRPLARPFQPAEVAAGLADTLRPFAHRKELELRLSLAGSAARTLDSDPELVKVMLEQLLLNAIRRSSRGVVEVSVASASSGWRFAVNDPGPTLAGEALRAAFDVSGAAGPGLALVRDLSVALGGKTEVASMREYGTTFAVLLPQARAAATAGS